MKEATSILVLQLLVNSGHVRIHSDLCSHDYRNGEENDEEEEKEEEVEVLDDGGMGHSVRRLKAGHDVCLLTFTNYPQLALPNAKAYSLCVCECVCVSTLGAILNVHMFKAI